jgi:tRNA A37 threonylcarbamoyladenosine biosynthesis protein TsaE
MHHFDFYRLHDPGLVAYELAEVIDDPKAVTVIEWADIVEDVLPPHRVIITLNRSHESVDQRVIKIECPEPMAYLKGAWE